MDARFEDHLQALLEQQLTGVPKPLAESIRYSLLSPGKRIRPRVLIASARLFDLDEATALPAAAALEMIHCYTLIHDDLPSMDNDDFRRGKPSNHKVFGEALALLAGDALILIAQDTLMQATAEAQPLLRALKRLSNAAGVRGVIAGQAAETELTENSQLEDLLQVHSEKTGALFQAAILIPAELADLDLGSPRGQSLHEFAEALGLAFQIQDDLADAEQDQASGPTNILHYLSRERAASMARDLLKTTGDQLRETWGVASQDLLSIASEVERHL